MRRVVLATVLATMAWPLFAAESSSAPGIELQLTRDTGGFEANRVRTLALARYDNPWSYRGVAIQSTGYEQGGYRRRTQGALYVHRDQRRDNLAGLDLAVGAVRVAGHTRPVGELTLRFATRLDAPSYELIAAADVVETRPALERGIAYGLAGAGVEVPLDAHFTVTGFSALQGFTDGNTRMHLRGRLIFLASEAEGVTLQLRYRGFRSEEADVEGAYFNPRRHHRWLGAVAMRRRSGHWTYHGELATGRERSDGVSRPARVAEVRAEGPVAGDVRVLLRAGYQRTAGFSADPDYAYRFGGITFIVPLE